MNIVTMLLVAAFVTCILDAIGKCPLWVSVLLVIVAMFLGAR